MSTRHGIRSNSLLSAHLGQPKTDFLQHALGAFERILPHVETSAWKVAKAAIETGVTWEDSSRRGLRIALGLKVAETDWSITAIVRRRQAPKGVGAISRTLDNRERLLAQQIVNTLHRLLSEVSSQAHLALQALQARFDEAIVAAHLNDYHDVQVPLSEWFTQIRQMAEQTYENKALTFGCIVDKKSTARPRSTCSFPTEFLVRKRYRALSDGYRTAYQVSRYGAVTGFVNLSGNGAGRDRFYPEWTEDLVSASTDLGMGLSLTRQGDILVFDHGRLSFSYCAEPGLMLC